MMGKPGPETLRARKMRDAGRAEYGDRLVTIKYHGDMMGEAGVSDLLHCLDGVFVAIEVKHEKNYGNSVERAIENGPTLKQRAFIGRVLAAGGVAGVAVTVEQYLEILACAAERDGGWGGCGHRCTGHNYTPIPFPETQADEG